MAISGLLVAVLLLVLHARSGAAPSFTTAAVIGLLAWVILAGGRRLALAAGLRGDDPAPAWVLGLVGLCLAIYVFTLVLPVTAGGAFMLVAVGVAAIEIALRRRPVPRVERKAAIGFALAVALTAAWCWAPARAFEAVRTQGVLPLWVDYFFHGALISQFGDPRAFGRGSILLADQAPSFYHFASYGPAAALARLLDQPGLALATTAWLPLGVLAMLAGGYALGARLAGPAGGLAALAALALIPDASHYGLRNGWFSFHWTLFAHAGASYALGAALLALAMLDGSRRTLAAGALLALSALLLRAHVFLLLLPAWCAAAAVCATRGSRWRAAWLMAGVIAAGAAAARFAVGELADAGFWRLRNPSAFYDFLWYVHTGHEPTAYPGLYERLTQIGQPIAFALFVGVVFAVAAALGAFALALPAVAFVAARRGALRPIDSACAFLAFTWMLLMFLAPTPWHGDPSDLIHRPFVLLYGACAIWTLCLLVRLSPRPAWSPLLALSLLALPALVAGAAQMIQPRFAWGAADAAERVPPGLAEAAAYLRRHAGRGDAFAAAGLSVDQATFDLSTKLCALSGVPAYLSRPYYEMIKDAPRRKLVEARLAALQEVDRHTDGAAALRALQALGVRWYVVVGDQGPSWDPRRSRAAFSAGTVSLYRTP